MNIKELIRRYTADVEASERELHALTDGRTGKTEAEDNRAVELTARLQDQRAKLREVTDVEADEKRIDAGQRDIRPTNAGPARKYDQVLRVGREPRTYRSPEETPRDSTGAPSEPTFLNDLYRSQILNDPSASERIARHGQEMTTDHPAQVQRAVSTGGVPGFLPPAYLTELFAEFARAGRPTANLCRTLPLPAEGMSVNIPRVTTASATAVQATENATVANNDPAATLLTAPVVTVAGYVVLSRQSVERGPLTEEIVTSDLSADYNAKLDAQVLNGSGNSGQHLGILGVSGINAVTYTAASPVLVGATTPMWPKLASAVGQVISSRYAGPTGIVMSPTEWAWMLAATDPSTNRPIIQPNQQGGAFNPAGTMDESPTYGGVAGHLFNLPVYLDGNMPSNLGAGTNETRLIVADFEDVILFEDNNGAPNQLRFEQPAGNALGVMLIAYGYTAFAAGRQPKAISVLSGTGLITPSL